MSKVISLVNCSPTVGEYALEVEVTGSFPNIHTQHNKDLLRGKWVMERDGSIGEGLEFVSDGPTSMEALMSNVDCLYSLLRDNEIDFNNQDRAGVHLHMNVQQWTVNQLFTFIILFYIFEDVLVRFCGDMRDGNHFCLKVKDAEYQLFLLEQCLRERKLGRINTSCIRYSSLNLTSLFKYGSLEFRSMRTSEDEQDIKHWILLINCLKEYSMRIGSPDKILSKLTNDLYRDVFSGYLHLLDDPECCVDNYWIAHTLIMSTSWEERAVCSNPFRKVFENDKREQGVF